MPASPLFIGITPSHQLGQISDQPLLITKVANVHSVTCESPELQGL